MNSVRVKWKSRHINNIDDIEVAKVDKLISVITGLAFFAKQFYFSKSGTLQLGDILLMLATLISLFSYGVVLKRKDAPFAVFIIATIAINTIYYLLLSDRRFVLSILFMIFNALAVLFLFRPMLNKAVFLKAILISSKLVMLSQFLFLVTGIGEWAFDRKRYIGTFNDPNQYGFYILTCFFCIYVISIINKEKMGLFWIALTAIEILPSASTGMLATYLIFNVGYLLGLNTFENRDSSKKEIIAVVLMSIFVLLTAIFYRQILIAISNTGIFGINRIVERLLSSSSYGGLGREFMQDRGLMRVLELPQYFLFGSGEGGWSRFGYIYNEGYELHSTVLGLLYYYGIIPFCFLVKWVYNNLSNMITSVKFVYIALFLEACTLINHRQPIFWLLIVLAGHGALKSNKKKRFHFK